MEASTTTRFSRLANRLLSNRLVARFTSGAGLLSLGLIVARVLGAAFNLLMAKLLSPDGMGFLQTSIAWGNVIAIFTMPFGQHVVARYISANLKDDARRKEYLDACWAMLAVMIVATTALSIPFLLLLQGSINVGILVIFIGLTVFYTYYGVARGFMSNWRLLVIYLGSNLVQIVTTVFVYGVLHVRDPLPAAVIYGLSYFPMLAFLLLYKPLPLGTRLVRPRREIVVELLRYTAPLWVMHICYIVLLQLDIILLDRFATQKDAGVYGVVRTLSMVFVFAPQSISTVILPKIASAPPDRHRGLMWRAVFANVSVASIIFVGFVLLYVPVVKLLYPEYPEYVVPPIVYILFAIGTITHGTQSILEAAMMGKGNSLIIPVARFLALAAAFVVGIIAIPQYGIAGAALTACVGGVVTLGSYAPLLFHRTLGLFRR